MLLQSSETGGRQQGANPQLRHLQFNLFFLKTQSVRLFLRVF